MALPKNGPNKSDPIWSSPYKESYKQKEVPSPSFRREAEDLADKLGAKMAAKGHYVTEEQKEELLNKVFDTLRNQHLYGESKFNMPSGMCTISHCENVAIKTIYRFYNFLEGHLIDD